MATLAAVNQLGESVVALLRARRDLLASAGQLNSLPAAFPIEHVSAARIGTTPPTAGLSLTCYHIVPSEHLRAHPAARNPAQSTTISLELRYLLATWSAPPAEEQAMIAWAMLELARHPVLDRSALLGANVWDRDEVVQVLTDVAPPEQVMRVWDSLGQRYRLSFTLTARVVRIGYGPTDEWPAVVATRLGFADVDPLTEEPA
jgi:hypothetical protein